MKAQDHQHKVVTKTILDLPSSGVARFIYDSGYSFSYLEDGVRGVDVTENSAGGQRLCEL